MTITYDERIIGNKLIANFMGGKYKISQEYLPMDSMWLPTHGICKHDTIELGKGKIFQYHASWDWLIPVAAKIAIISEEPEELDSLKSAILFNDINTAWKDCVNWLKEHTIKL